MPKIRLDGLTGTTAKLIPIDGKKMEVDPSYKQGCMVGINYLGAALYAPILAEIKDEKKREEAIKKIIPFISVDKERIKTDKSYKEGVEDGHSMVMCTFGMMAYQCNKK